jgi:adenosine deaminase
MKAKAAGLGVTIHTGEVTTSEEVKEVIRLLYPDRIGHGIASVKDSSLLKELSKQKIVLEICPSSNIKTNAVSGWDEMKKIIRTFIKENVLFTINSDGPVLLSTNIKQEFELLFQKGILSKNEISRIIKLAESSAFIKNSL